MAKFVPQEEMSLLDQVQVRHDKLAALRAEGRDPFVQTKYDFNADSAKIKGDYAAFEGKTVRVAGPVLLPCPRYMPLPVWICRRPTHFG